MIQSTVWSSRLLLALGPNSTPLRTNICPTGSVIQSVQWIFYPEIGRSKGHPSCFNGSTGLIGSTILLLDLENNGPRKNSGKVRPRIGDENFHDFTLFFFRRCGVSLPLPSRSCTFKLIPIEDYIPTSTIRAILYSFLSFCRFHF